ncbi:MAG TPA: hypothetical protein VEK15_05125, partial [Vicinamibacteria bacterium]|nr:hypothetical protein [Vicinamibacteria bacterium]
FSASSDVLAYSVGQSDRRLAWFDREGRSLGGVGEPGPFVQVTLSPDGRRAIVIRESSLWILDLERGGIASRLTPDGYRTADAAWSPDGREIAMSARLSTTFDLYRLTLAAGAEPELVLSSEKNLWLNQWLAADNRLSFHDGFMIGLVPMEGSHEPQEIVRQKGRLDETYRSPDGKWLAFIADETGRFEVYVERLDTKERLRVSSEGGGQPRWRSDGRELFFLSSDAHVMAVDFDPELGARGVARSLFEVPVAAVLPQVGQWDVHPDGERFLFLVPAGEERTIHVVLNWRRLLEEDGSR